MNNPIEKIDSTIKIIEYAFNLYISLTESFTVVINNNKDGNPEEQTNFKILLSNVVVLMPESNIYIFLTIDSDVNESIGIPIIGLLRMTSKADM